MKEGPRLEFFEEMFKKLDEIRIIVEDLGLITPEVNLLSNIVDFPE